MKSQYRMLFIFIALLLVVSLACGGGGNVVPTTPPTNVPAPTNEVAPPTANVPDVQPTQEQQQPEPSNQQFFTEEFDAPLSSSWFSYIITGSDKSDPDKVTVEPENGKLVWDFDSEEVYYYLFYEGFSYTDVKVEARADNRGKNNNNVSLICRYDPEVGWYEFSIANNGLYWIYYAEIASDGDFGGYSLITNGGSNDIKQGKDTNEYSITCSGEKLTLTINGEEVTTITERKYGLSEGGVGVNVSSLNVLPILVDMEWFKVSEP